MGRGDRGASGPWDRRSRSTTNTLGSAQTRPHSRNDGIHSRSCVREVGGGGRPPRPSVPPKGSPERPDPQGLPFGSLRSALDRPDNPVMTSLRRTTGTTSSPTIMGAAPKAPRSGSRTSIGSQGLGCGSWTFGSKGCQPTVPVEVGVMAGAGPPRDVVQGGDRTAEGESLPFGAVQLLQRAGQGGRATAGPPALLGGTR